jgi:hypothetical protein
MADEAPINHQSRYLETSGLLKVPLIALTTLRDPEVPGWQTVEYMRKQKQVCESSGSRVLNDTVEEYFGHAHADALGADLSEHLDTLYSLIHSMRMVDDTSLTQRSWVKSPLRMVDPELAACPSQCYWYNDMLGSLKRAIKSGTLRTNKKINQMILDLEGATPTPKPNPVTATTTGASAGAVSMAVKDTAGGVSDAIGSVGGGAMTGMTSAGSVTTKSVGRMAGGAEGSVQSVGNGGGSSGTGTEKKFFNSKLQ